MKANDIIRDRYQLLRPLGSGGFGEVWLANDMKTHTDCALKFYVRLDDKGREEFSSEYSRMLGISHPNLLTAKYYDEWQDRPFLVMDYCGGGAASDRVGQLSETELWRLIRDVTSGLACLHSQRDAQGKEAPVIHQDIKPANFLQKGDGTWLISDFGISSRMRSSMSSQSGREVSSGGTIPYMGPERFGQDRMLVKASDIWSIGASVYEMATGDVPFGEFGGGTQRAGAEIPHLPKEIWSSDLVRLVSSCLQKETWDRPSAELVAKYADCKLKGKSLPKLPKEALPPPPNPNPKPKPWKWIAVAVVATVLAIVLWPKPSVDQAYKACQTVADYRAYMRSYGTDAPHYTDAKKFVDDYVADSVAKAELEMENDRSSTAQPSGSSITVTANGVSFVMKRVEGGTFQMGSDDNEAYDDEKPVHSVTVSTFYMGETEVTQALWKAVMGSEPTYDGGWEDKCGRGNNYPAYRVSWDDSQEFIRKLNELTGRSFRLPTEAEWEYAARGGSRSSGTNYAGNSSIDSVAWYEDNSDGTPHSVKGKSPNELGLYDMSGNVYEWCSDWYSSSYYSSSPSNNPKGPSSGSNRVIRGGSWNYYAGHCRVSHRNGGAPGKGIISDGFRLALPQ